MDVLKKLKSNNSVLIYNVTDSGCPVLWVLYRDYRLIKILVFKSWRKSLEELFCFLRRECNISHGFRCFSPPLFWEFLLEYVSVVFFFVKEISSFYIGWRELIRSFEAVVNIFACFHFRRKNLWDLFFWYFRDIRTEDRVNFYIILVVGRHFKYLKRNFVQGTYNVFKHLWIGLTLSVVNKPCDFDWSACFGKISVDPSVCREEAEMYRKLVFLLPKKFNCVSCVKYASIICSR